jgi:thioredoxin reductase
MPTENSYDVIIIGGSYAGLSAAMALVRARRKVLMIDSGTPANRMVKHAHNLIAHENEDPQIIRTKALQELRSYPTFTFENNTAANVLKNSEGFYVDTIDQKNYTARKILFTTGISDLMPGIAGFTECWGDTILHCPYCHGYEVKDQPIAIIANGEHAYHLCVLLSNLSKQLSLFTNEDCTLSHEQVKHLQQNKISLSQKKIKEMKHENGKLHTIVFTDGSSEKFSAAFAKVMLRQQCEIPEKMGCKFNEHLIAVDECMRTSIDGVFAAGDNCFLPRSISFAMGAGARAGFQINWELTSADFGSLGK